LFDVGNGRIAKMASKRAEFGLEPYANIDIMRTGGARIIPIGRFKAEALPLGRHGP